MGVMKTAPLSHDAPRRKIKLQRTYRASIRDVWDLWTTKNGIESWWGPDGFETKVLEIDPRPGGVLRYEMTATGPEQVEFVKKEGLPLAGLVRATFREVEPMHRLVLSQTIDFIAGVPPYEMAVVVEIRSRPRGTRMALTIDPGHNEEWTERSHAGWESQLGRADKVMAPREAQYAAAHA